jgi:nucleotide-binding universal stress UspA family protein
MRTVIVPVNDASEAESAARRAIDLYRREAAEIHVLNVQRPLPLHIAQFFGRDELASVHREAGMRVLERAVDLLEEARVPHQAHVLVGKPAETIVRFAEGRPGAEIALDTASPGLFARLGVGSIASQVRHLMASHAAGAAAAEATTTR